MDLPAATNYLAGMDLAAAATNYQAEMDMDGATNYLAGMDLAAAAMNYQARYVADVVSKDVAADPDDV